MRVALLGYGTVGQGVAGILAAHPEWELELASVLVRDPSKPRDVAPTARLVTDPREAVAGADVVVEVNGEVDGNRALLGDALRAGVPVVTANKALLSAHLEELLAAAEEGGTTLRFEAAVAAGIPVIAETLSQRRTGAITAVEGVLNGSCNYVLSGMAAGRGFDDMCAEALRLGYLEEDPSADLDGHDALRKLRILATLAFGRPVLEGGIARQCISDVTPAWVAEAASRGNVVKQVSRAVLATDGSVEASVGPVEVPAASLLGGLGGATNAVTLHHEHLGPLTLVGPGAGRWETANAVVTDLLDAVDELRRRPQTGTAPAPATDSGEDR